MTLSYVETRQLFSMPRLTIFAPNPRGHCLTRQAGPVSVLTKYESRGVWLKTVEIVVEEKLWQPSLLLRQDEIVLRVNTVIEGGPYLLFEGPALT